MIVDAGVAKLLASELSYLSTLTWALFTSNTTILNTTLFTDLTEAAWTGYARVASSGWGNPTAALPRQQTVPNTMPVFNNTSAAPVTFQGWALIDTSTGPPTLIAAVNTGPLVIPPGQSFVLAPAVTDRQE
jgi:hypothetical protein